MARQVTWFPPAHTGIAPIIFTDRGAGYRVEKGTRGLGAVRRQLVTEESPWVDGAAVDDDFALPRTVMLPIMLWGKTREDMLAKLSTLQAAMRTRKPGRVIALGELELAQADGRKFRVRCNYLDGLPDEEDIQRGGDTNWVRFQLQLYAGDPYWYASGAKTLSWVFSNPTPFLGNPFLPLNISATQVIGAATIVNGGTEDTYGTWRVTGPGTALILTNPSSGETFRVNGTIPVGQVLTIVTDPASGRISLQPSGDDWWPNLADGSTLWAIPPGTTAVSLTLTGAAGGSRIDLEYFEKFGSPW